MNDDGGHVATAPGTAKTKKKKIGKKERMKLKAKQLMEEGMSEADARKQAGSMRVVVSSSQRARRSITVLLTMDDFKAWTPALSVIKKCTI